MDFESMAMNRNFPVLLKPSMINELTHPLPAPMMYQQDQLGTDKINRVRVYTVGGDTQNFHRAAGQQKRDLEDAAEWPVTSLKKNCYTPYIVAGILMFFALPALLPQFGVGETVLVSYSAGGLTYYMKFAGGPQLKTERN